MSSYQVKDFDSTHDEQGSHWLIKEGSVNQFDLLAFNEIEHDKKLLFPDSKCSGVLMFR